MLSNRQAGPGRKVKQEQEDISRNHVQAFFPGSVYLKILNSKSIYLRHDVSAVKSSISPWVSSWFMASAPRGGHHHRRAGRRHRLLAQEPASRRVLLATQVEGGMNFCSAGPTNKKSVRNRNLSELCQISRNLQYNCQLETCIRKCLKFVRCLPDICHVQKFL